MDTQATLDAVEGYLDAVEPIIDSIEAAPTIVKNNPLLIVAVAVAGLGVGATAATLITRKRLSKKYDELAQKEIAQAKIFYSRLQKPENPEDLLGEDVLEDDEENSPGVTQGEMIQAASDIMEKQKYISYDKISTGDNATVKITETTVAVTESIAKNIFDTEGTTTPYDESLEMAKREQSLPYIVTEDEALNNDRDFRGVSMTYYTGDNVLATDENGEQVVGITQSIGTLENLRFGYGTEHPDTVYICNEKIGAYYEITKNEGHYAREILGLELEHSDNRRYRGGRPHWDDES